MAGGGWGVVIEGRVARNGADFQGPPSDGMRGHACGSLQAGIAIRAVLRQKRAKCALREGMTMDYGKSGAVQVGKNTPRFKDNAPKEGKASAPKEKRLSKDEMIAKLKAAAEAKKAAGQP